jgi:hypothetical protein
MSKWNQVISPSKPDTVNRAGGEALEDHSEFYRDASVLAPTHEQIARRAYELYLARGRVDGFEREDWMEAEKQLSVSEDDPTGI